MRALLRNRMHFYLHFISNHRQNAQRKFNEPSANQHHASNQMKLCVYELPRSQLVQQVHTKKGNNRLESFHYLLNRAYFFRVCHLMPRCFQ